MATTEELTQQVVSLNQKVADLHGRLQRQAQAGAGGQQASGTAAQVHKDDGKRLFPEGLGGKDGYREWAEYFLDWLEDRDEGIHTQMLAAVESASADPVPCSADPRLAKNAVQGHEEAGEDGHAGQDHCAQHTGADSCGSFSATFPRS